MLVKNGAMGFFVYSAVAGDGRPVNSKKIYNVLYFQFQSKREIQMPLSALLSLLIIV